MSTEPLMVVDGGDAPGVVRAGSGMDYGHVTLGTVQQAAEEARRIAFTAPGMSHDQLVDAMAELAGVVADLAGEVYQLSRGIAHRRVAVFHGDD